MHGRQCNFKGLSLCSGNIEESMLTAAADCKLLEYRGLLLFTSVQLAFSQDVHLCVELVWGGVQEPLRPQVEGDSILPALADADVVDFGCFLQIRPQNASSISDHALPSLIAFYSPHSRPITACDCALTGYICLPKDSCQLRLREKQVSSGGAEGKQPSTKSRSAKSQRKRPAGSTPMAQRVRAVRCSCILRYQSAQVMEFCWDVLIVELSKHQAAPSACLFRRAAQIHWRCSSCTGEWHEAEAEGDIGCAHSRQACRDSGARRLNADVC